MGEHFYHDIYRNLEGMRKDTVNIPTFYLFWSPSWVFLL